MTDEKGSRNICFTLFNFELLDKIIDYNYEYLVMGYEICPTTNRPHYQSFFKFKSVKEYKVLHRAFPGVNVEGMHKYSSIEEAIAYCKKDGKWKEWGTSPINKQGYRSDINTVKDKILNGEIDCREIICNNPMLYHQYGRTFDKLEDIRMEKLFRTEMTEGWYLWGGSGAGKSHSAFKNYHPDTHYILNLQDKGWWDGYRQQETVIINEFRGQIPYGELNDLIDKWPKTVSRRNRQPLPFTSKRVIITSSMPPEEVYHNLSENDELTQLFRRFKIIHVRSGQEVIIGS